MNTCSEFGLETNFCNFDIEIHSLNVKDLKVFLSVSRHKYILELYYDLRIK